MRNRLAVGMLGVIGGAGGVGESGGACVTSMADIASLPDMNLMVRRLTHRDGMTRMAHLTRQPAHALDRARHRAAHGQHTLRLQRQGQHQQGQKDEAQAGRHGRKSRPDAGGRSGVGAGRRAERTASAGVAHLTQLAHLAHGDDGTQSARSAHSPHAAPSIGAGRQRCKRQALATTPRLLHAMAAPARAGLSWPAMASGRAIRL